VGKVEVLNIIIMARERQSEVMRAISAIRNVDFGMKTQIIVSDNASVPEKALKNLPPDIKHLLRFPSGDTFWHFNTIISETDSEWVLITHDDDELLAEFGTFFQTYSSDENVSVISGRSRILNSEGKEIFSKDYETRLISAGLVSNEIRPISNFPELLFRHGSLFPASAIAVRGELLKNMPTMTTDTGLAYDLAYSFRVSNKTNVVFQGSTPIMNYYIHGGNSVFTPDAFSGLHFDLLIARLESIKLRIVKPNIRKYSKLILESLKARLISYAFGNLDKVLFFDSYVNRNKKSLPFGFVFSILKFKFRFKFFLNLVRKSLERRIMGTYE
jgi:hypothetical protein